jgi:hypothetical protein
VEATVTVKLDTGELNTLREAIVTAQYAYQEQINIARKSLDSTVSPRQADAARQQLVKLQALSKVLGA